MARWNVAFVALLVVAAGAALVVAELGPDVEGDLEVIQTVVEEQESESDDLTLVTYLTITVTGNSIRGTTNDGKTFRGTGASGYGTGVGILTKLSLGIYDATVSYEVFAGTGVQNINFYNARSRVVGLWSGAIVPPVPASQGPGNFTG